MTILTIVSLIGLSLGAIYGLACLANPGFAASSVRLQANPDQPGGYAEFRATFGGVFLGLHLAAIAFLISSVSAAPVAAGVIAAGWFGAAIGRALALTMDGEQVANTSLNAKLIVLEVVMALAIASPLLQVLLSN